MSRGAWPYVSVVIPARDEQAYLRGCVDAVLAQDYPAEQMEVLIVEGRSTDATREIALEYARGWPRIRVLDNPARLAAPALNHGIRQARGGVIVRVDAHTVVPADYVRCCVDALAATDADVVGGPRRLDGRGFWGQVNARALGSAFVSPARFHRSPGTEEVDSVFLGAFRRDRLLEVGLLDESLPWNEDYEVNYRIRRAGGRVVSVPNIRPVYFARESCAGLAKQFWGYGRGKAMVLKRHPTSIALRHAIAPIFVLALAISLALAPAGQPGWLAALLGAYAAASVSFARTAARGCGVRFAAAVALAFACAHLAWGTGLLVELLRPGPVRVPRKQASLAA